MFSRILVAADRTESGDAAVSFTAALAREHSATVRVVHVNELLVGGRGVAVESDLEAMDVVDTAVARLRGDGVDADGVHFLANCFTVADRIAEAAQDWGAEVIVFGSNRRRRFARFGGSGLRERVDRGDRAADAHRTGSAQGTEGNRHPTSRRLSCPG